MKKVVELRKIRMLEAELSAADPAKAARLARTIVKRKAELFKKDQ